MNILTNTFYALAGSKILTYLFDKLGVPEPPLSPAKSILTVWINSYTEELCFRLPLSLYAQYVNKYNNVACLFQSLIFGYVHIRKDFALSTSICVFSHAFFGGMLLGNLAITKSVANSTLVHFLYNVLIPYL